MRIRDIYLINDPSWKDHAPERKVKAAEARCGRIVLAMLHFQDRMQQMVSNFVQIDSDNDERLNFDEFSVLIRGTEPGMHLDVELRRRFTKLDADASGYIEKHEFFADMLIESLAYSRQRVIDLLLSWDADSSRRVCFDEFNRAIRELGIAEAVGQRAIELVFAALDEDGNGEISYKELATMMRPKTIARNKHALRRVASGRKSKLRQRISLTSGPGQFTVQAQLQAILKQDRARVIDLFREWDENEDGYITAVEFREAVRGLRLEAPRSEVDELFASFDSDRSGRVDFNEMNKVLRQGAPALAPGIRHLQQLQANQPPQHLPSHPPQAQQAQQAPSPPMGMASAQQNLSAASLPWASSGHGSPSSLLQLTLQPAATSPVGSSAQAQAAVAGMSSPSTNPPNSTYFKPGEYWPTNRNVDRDWPPSSPRVNACETPNNSAVTLRVSSSAQDLRPSSAPVLSARGELDSVRAQSKLPMSPAPRTDSSPTLRWTTGGGSRRGMSDEAGLCSATLTSTSASSFRAARRAWGNGYLRPTQEMHRRAPATPVKRWTPTKKPSAIAGSAYKLPSRMEPSTYVQGSDGRHYCSSDDKSMQLVLETDRCRRASGASGLSEETSHALVASPPPRTALDAMLARGDAYTVEEAMGQRLAATEEQVQHLTSAFRTERARVTQLEASMREMQARLEDSEASKSSAQEATVSQVLTIQQVMLDRLNQMQPLPKAA